MGSPVTTTTWLRRGDEDQTPTLQRQIVAGPAQRGHQATPEVAGRGSG